MPRSDIQPHKITRPIQLLAVWIAGLILLVGGFLTAAAEIPKPEWAAGLFSIAAVAMVPLFIVLIFVMQTKFRTQLQDDPYYAAWLQRQKEEFEDFAPENVKTTTGRDMVETRSALSGASGEGRRIRRYEETQGIFLVHTWRMSSTPGQVADIVIRLHQHGSGPLSEGKIESVEYNLGPQFFDGPIVKRNTRQDFRLEVSAYGPMLCLATVRFKDGSPDLQLERYVNFDGNV